MSKQSDSSPAQVLSNGKTANQVAGVESALVQGDLSKLTEPQRIQYYLKVCETVGLNPATKPFDYITLNGKLTLYATKACAEQLRSSRNVSVQIKSRETVGDCYVVTASASLPDGRVDESLGAVPVGGLKGDNLCNALMKAETKAKRRVTLSICGLGMLDESELDTIRDRVMRPVAPVQAIHQPEAPRVVQPLGKPSKAKAAPVEAVAKPAEAVEVAKVIEAELVKAEEAPKADKSAYFMQLISGPHKGKLISDLTHEQAKTYLADIQSHLDSINKPPSTLFGAHREIYYTLVKYVEEGEKA